MLHRLTLDRSFSIIECEASIEVIGGLVTSSCFLGLNDRSKFGYGR